MKATLFAFFFLAASCSLADDVVLPDFSKYPKSAGFDYFVLTHRSGDSFARRVSDHRQAADLDLSAYEPLFLVVSQFRGDSGRSALDYFVTASGYSTNCRDLYGYAVQATHESQLTVEQFAKLKEAVALLPKFNTYPPLDQLVIVSFRDGDSWITRTCRPEDVRSIYAVLRERFETADPRK